MENIIYSFIREPHDLFDCELGIFNIPRLVFDLIETNAEHLVAGALKISFPWIYPLQQFKFSGAEARQGNQSKERVHYLCAFRVDGIDGFRRLSMTY